MKLAQQLAEYLSANKKLTIQGIGNFLLDNSYNPDPDNRSKNIIQGNISFESNTAAKTDDGLIEFISTQTGKMKSLAASDLESQLELVHQFLNIGKPYLFDGIGTITKTKDGSFSFVQGVSAAEKIPDRGIQAHNEDMPDFKSVFLKEPKKINWQKPMIALFILLGLGLVIAGGYYLYKKTSGKETVTTETENNGTEQQEETVLAEDTSAVKKDSIPETPITTPVQPPVSAEYKFVVDQFKASRAFLRFNQLKSNGWPIKMETKDSVNYKLFITLPASTDTTRALDSLTTLNGRRVFIEHNK